MVPPRAAFRRLRIAALPMPGQAAGLAALVAVLAAAVVSAPLMTASADEGAWEQQLDRMDATSVGTTLQSATYTGDGQLPDRRLGLLDDLDRAVTETVADAGLRAPLVLTRSAAPTPAITPSGREDVAVVSRTGAAQHLEIVAGSGGGVLVPETLARDAGLAPGGTLTVLDRDGGPVPLTVGGVYRTPADPVPAWWTAQNYLFVPRFEIGALDPTPPPPAVFLPPDLALPTYRTLGEDVFVEWFLPAPAAPTVGDARRTSEAVTELQLRLTDPESPVATLVKDEHFAAITPRTALPGALTRVDRTVELLSPPVRGVGIAGGLAALVLVGAWAGLRVRRREDELRSLVARGLSPARAAGIAVRESLLPVLLGLAVGGVAGWVLVRELGPAPGLDPSAFTDAGVGLAAAAGAALALVAVVTAVLVARLDSVGGRGPAAQLLGRVPWLAVLTTLTAAAAVPLITGAGSADAGSIGILPLLVPLLVTAVAAGALTALLPLVGARLGGRLQRLPVAGFLATRRVLAGAPTARLVTVTTAIALGLVVYAGALADSTDRTVAAKAAVATGSDVVVPLARTSSTAGPRPPSSMVVGASTDPVLVPGKTAVDVIAVHPEQVAGVVRWDDSFADRPLADLMAALRDYDGDRVPVIVAGPLPDAVVRASDGGLVLDFTYYSVPVQIVGRATAFPGQGSHEPLLVADWNRYSAALDSVSRVADIVLERQVWARGDADVVTDALARAGYETTGVRTAADFAARPELDAQTWSLSYLRSVALAAGLLGLVGLVLNAVAQQRRRTVADLLLRRMGVTRRTADRATALEIGLLAGTAALVAVAVAIPSSALLLRALDPVPQLEPAPVLAVPWGTLGVVLAGVVLVALAGAALVGRAARRTSGGQVLRDAA